MIMKEDGDRPTHILRRGSYVLELGLEQQPCPHDAIGQADSYAEVVVAAKCLDRLLRAGADRAWRRSNPMWRVGGGQLGGRRQDRRAIDPAPRAPRP